MPPKAIRPWLLGMLLRLMLCQFCTTRAFRLSTSSLQESNPGDRTYSDADSIGDITSNERRRRLPPSSNEHDVDLLIDGGTSREGFLQNVAGVGLLAAAGISSFPEPGHALFEDFRKPGKCPKYEAVSNFDVDKYMGIWYELAYHDWTQIPICGCTRFNMTLTDTKVKDAFTTTCPYGSDLADTFLINMREAVDFATPGSFKEYAFYNKWDNKVVALWRSTDDRGLEGYERAIQMQCVEILGRRAFVGINFLSRVPIVSAEVLDDMFDKARMIGLAGIGGSKAEMEIVGHKGCRYPTSSANPVNRSWGSGLGVNILVE